MYLKVFFIIRNKVCGMLLGSGVVGSVKVWRRRLVKMRVG